MRYLLESTKGSRRNGVYYVRDRKSGRIYTFGSRKAATDWISNQEFIDATIAKVLS